MVECLLYSILLSTWNLFVGWVEGIILRLFYCLGFVVRSPLQG